MTLLSTLRRIPLHCYALPRSYLLQTVYSDACADESVGEKRGLVPGDGGGDKEEMIITKTAVKFTGQLEDILLELVKSGGCRIKRGAGKIFNSIDKEIWSIALMGLGRENLSYCKSEAVEEGLEAVREVVRTGTRLLEKDGIWRSLIRNQEQATKGSTLAMWWYQDSRSRQYWRFTRILKLFDDNDAESFQRGLFETKSQNLVSRVSNTTALDASGSEVYCSCQTMLSQVRNAEVIGSRIWRHPLWKYFTKKVTEFQSYNVRNKGVGHDFSCIEAAFLLKKAEHESVNLLEFFDYIYWIHFNITGVGLQCKENIFFYLLTGRMTDNPLGGALI
ncbi:cytosol aminopeptidase-like [Euwallacea fornicatus]|uniref:cytosol aminopeptidase-like n=1 Tax=Euwallacea fornicatus TaxID=995702 RepID=UPI00338DDA95